MAVLSKVRLYISNEEDPDEMAIEVIVLNLPIFPIEYDVSYHLRSADGLLILDELKINTRMGIHVESRGHHANSYAVNICMNATNTDEHHWRELLDLCNDCSVDSKRYPHEIAFDL